MSFADALKAQADLQVAAYSIDPSRLSPEDRNQFIMWNVVALTDELHEALGEVGWKPWATSRHLNRDAYKGELVDALHFFMNLMLAANISAEELLEGYFKKREKNAQRQRDGYDGVKEKCPVCKRALDDDAVACYKITPEIEKNILPVLSPFPGRMIDMERKGVCYSGVEGM